MTNKPPFLKRSLASMILLLGPVLCLFAVDVVLAIWLHPVPGQHYDGYLGSFAGAQHGAVFIGNWLTSFFDETRLLKATSATGWYDFFWWAGVCMSSLLSFAVLGLGAVLGGAVMFTSGKSADDEEDSDEEADDEEDSDEEADDEEDFDEEGFQE